MTQDGLNPIDVAQALAFFHDYSHIVLVANSDAIDIEGLQKAYPDDTLFVFFNKVYKVLDTPFTGKSLLVARSGMMGANIVHRREVGDVVRFFDPKSFRGILNIMAAPTERFSEVSAFDGATVRHLDLSGRAADFYPAGKIPTSGFALALWLSDLGLNGKVVLAGFTGKRSDKWKVFDVHDWTFEQIFLRLFAQSGKLSMTGKPATGPYGVFIAQFPELSAGQIALTASEVLSERLDGANAQIDRLLSLTKIIVTIDGFFRRFKPKTRKQRFIAQNVGQTSQNADGKNR